VQEGGGGILAIDHQIVRKAPPEGAHRPAQEALPGGILAVARSVGFDIQWQRETGAHHADRSEVVPVAGDLLVGIAERAAQRTTLMPAAPGGGPVDGETDEAGVFKRLVALGPAHRRHQRGSGGGWVQPFGEVTEGIVAKTPAEAQRTAAR